MKSSNFLNGKNCVISSGHTELLLEGLFEERQQLRAHLDLTTDG